MKKKGNDVKKNPYVGNSAGIHKAPGKIGDGKSPKLTIHTNGGKDLRGK